MLFNLLQSLFFWILISTIRKRLLSIKRALCYNPCFFGFSFLPYRSETRLYQGFQNPFLHLIIRQFKNQPFLYMFFGF